MGAHVHGLLLLRGRAALAARYADLQSYVHHATGARVTAAQLDELLDHELAHSSIGPKMRSIEPFFSSATLISFQFWVATSLRRPFCQ